MTFATLAGQWETSVLPMYKYSPQKNRRYILHKHLLPRLGNTPLFEVTRQAVQAYVAHLAREEYAPKSIDHIHDVLSAVLRTAVKWGHLEDNPARGVDLPKLRTMRPKWALTTTQAAALLEALPVLPRTMVGLAILSGLRRGEVFALRWRDVDETARVLTVREAVYDGRFSTPKTEAGARQVPLSVTALGLVRVWRAGRTMEPGELMFSTRSGTPIAPNNVLRRAVFPACDRLGLPPATRLTFRRTYASWSHEKGVPDRVLAQLMGPAFALTRFGEAGDTPTSIRR